MSPEDSEGRPTPKPSEMAMLAVQNTEFYRSHAAGFGLDADKVVRGYLFRIIVEDDRNIFVTLLNPEFPSLNADQRLQAVTDLKARLGLEIDATELPQDIRDKLTQVRKGIELLDFGTIEGFKSAYDIWEEMRQSIEEEIKELPELTADRDYFNKAILEFNFLKRKTQSGK